MMILRLSLILLIPFFFSFRLEAAPLELSIEAQGAILINGETGAILFEKNADNLFFPASITKIATALYVLNTASNRLDEKVIAKADALASISPSAKRESRYRAPSHLLETDGTHIGIKRGEEFRLYDLVYGMLLRSANDASNVIAQHLGGTIPNFMCSVNRTLKELGCKKTHFSNPHGLHHPDHVTTPKEMALIAKEAMRFPLFRKMVSSVRYTIGETNLQEERRLLQTNLLLRTGPNFYPRAIGIKTGTNSNAGKTLVAAAEEKGERMLIAVVMGYTGKGDRYSDVIKMFDAAFSEKKYRATLLATGVQKLKFNLPNARAPLKIVLKEPLTYDYYPSEKEEAHLKLKWEKLELPLAANSLVGEVIATDRFGRTLGSVACFAAEEVKPTLSYLLKKFLSDKGKGLAIIIGTLIMLYSLLRLRRRKRVRS